jgi:hypothetical protein
MEEYKIITTFPNYSISNLGNCKNNKTNRILKNRPMKIGYFQVQLFNDETRGGNGQNHYIHRLVALYFIENPNNKTDVDHKNGNKSDHSIENLRWVSKSENMRNQKKATNKSSSYVGISYDSSRNKWQSKIEINSIVKTFGRFDNERDAVGARNNYITDNNLSEFFSIQ